MKCEFLDHIVVEAVVQRLSMPDAVNLLGATRGEHASERADLREEIEGYQTWLEAVRQRAMREHNLDLLFDQEARAQPLIEAAQRRLDRLTDLDPSVSNLMRSGDLRGHWTAPPAIPSGGSSARLSSRGSRGLRTGVKGAWSRS